MEGKICLLKKRIMIFFLQLVAKHILPTSKLFAYSLMPNHFHLFIQLKTEEELITQYEQQIKSRLILSTDETTPFNLQNF